MKDRTQSDTTQKLGGKIWSFKSETVNPCLVISLVKR